MLNNYEINNKTLVIIPIGKNLSRVIEEDNILLVNKKSTDIIDDSCKSFGSSFVGRQEGSKYLIGVNYKTPILVEETNNIIFFPTSSPRINNCYWISFNNIKDKKKINSGKSKIIFNNSFELEINISIGSLENQIMRATLLESKIRNRKI
jgi:competence protein ComK